MPQSSPVGLDIGVHRIVVTGILIIFDCFKETVITSFPCPINNRFVEPEEDDGWDSSWFFNIYYLTALLTAIQIFKTRAVNAVWSINILKTFFNFKKTVYNY